MGVQPRKSQSKGILMFRIMRDHEIDEFGNSRLVCPWRSVIGDDDVRQSLNHGVLRRGEKLRLINRRLALSGFLHNLPAGKSPFAESRESRGSRRHSHDAQDFAPMYSLSRHDLSFYPNSIIPRPSRDLFPRLTKDT